MDRGSLTQGFLRGRTPIFIILGYFWGLREVRAGIFPWNGRGMAGEPRGASGEPPGGLRGASGGPPGGLRGASESGQVSLYIKTPDLPALPALC